MPQIFFLHPEPHKPAKRILPVFIPFHGCSRRCIYCAQNMQTGAGRPGLDQIFAKLSQDLRERAKRGEHGLGLGFFGGTFTALPRQQQEQFLVLARIFRHQGLINHVRCSTRPDAFDPDLLQWLKQNDVDMIELGIQSFNPGVLAKSQRGYSRQLALQACRQVRRSGLELGVQLLPGLPGSSGKSWQNDIADTCKLGPQAVRIYPCLVLNDTPLARDFHRGTYIPWSLRQTIWAVSQALLALWSKNIPVIRLGLAPEQDLANALLAGPWHPALGHMAKSLALRGHILKMLAVLSSTKNQQALKLFVPRRYAAEFWGHGRTLARAWHRTGLSVNAVSSWDHPLFCLIAKTVGPSIPAI